LVRHGAVSYFEPGHDLGRDDPPLSPTGVEQAQALGRLLASEPIDLVVSTGLRRTEQTARLATAQRELDITVVDGLSEAKAGDFDEIDTPEEMEALFVRAFDGAEVPGASFLAGETFEALAERVGIAWQSLIGRTDWAHALVVAHGVVNRAILARSLDAGPQIYRRLEQDAGCLNVLDIEGAGDEAHVALVRLINFTPYNATKAGMHETTLELLWRQFVGR
jgi:probable phosphoglycerate mutase